MIVLVPVVAAAVVVMASGVWVALVLVNTISKSPRRTPRQSEGVEDTVPARTH